MSLSYPQTDPVHFSKFCFQSFSLKSHKHVPLYWGQLIKRCMSECGNYLLLRSLGFDGCLLSCGKDRPAFGENSVCSSLGHLVRIPWAKKELGFEDSEGIQDNRSLVSRTFTFRYQVLLNVGRRGPTISHPFFLRTCQRL